MSKDLISISIHVPTAWIYAKNGKGYMDLRHIMLDSYIYIEPDYVTEDGLFYHCNKVDSPVKGFQDVYLQRTNLSAGIQRTIEDVITKNVLRGMDAADELDIPEYEDKRPGANPTRGWIGRPGCNRKTT